MGYKFIETLTFADVAFEAYGKSLEEMFKEAGLALENVQIYNLNKVKKIIEKNIEIKGKDEEELLFKFLQEIIFLKDSEKLIFSDFEIKIERNKELKLKGVLKGEKIDFKRHHAKIDVKAVTLHMFEVKKIKDKWYCRVILDV